VARSGETVVGRERIRQVLRGMIDTKTRLHGRVVRAVAIGDVALLYTDFDGTAVDAPGRRAEVHHKTIEVLGRQPDGTWKLIVGDPNARE
jgi:ketosteroid isomerase-like protein